MRLQLLLPLLVLVVAAVAAVAAAAVQTGEQDAGQQHNNRGDPRNRKQIVWDFTGGGGGSARATSSGGLAFALEPPSFVEYLNSTGAVIACRPTLATQSGAAVDLEHSSAATNSLQRKQLSQPISITWRQVSSNNGLNVVEQQQQQQQQQHQEQEELGEQQENKGRFVRQDGALVLQPGGAGKADLLGQIYRCCLANQFGSLCSRPVRTRAVPEPNGISLDVFDELAPVGSSIQLKCLPSPPSLQKYLDFTHWLKDDKIIASIQQQQQQQQQSINQKYLMLATGELIIRNVSQAADGGKSTGFKCRARHRITGQVITTKVGAKIIIDEQQQQQQQLVENQQSKGSRSQSDSHVWAHENSDQLICAQFSPFVSLPSTTTTRAKQQHQQQFLWHFEQQPIQDQQIRQLDSCLLIRQVQLKHAGRYVCETGSGLHRASVHLSVASAKLSAQLQLVSAELSPLSIVPIATATGQTITTQLVQFGSSVHLNCSISGRPFDTIVWFKDSRLLFLWSSSSSSSKNATITSLDPSATSSSSDSSSNLNLKLVLPSVIKIEKFTLNNRGIYQCQAYSSLATPHHQLNNQPSEERDLLRSASSSLQLDIASSRPNLQQKFSTTNAALIRGATVSLQCSAFGLPTPKFIWFLDNFPIVSAGGESLNAAERGASEHWDHATTTTSDEFLPQFRQFTRMASTNSASSKELQLNNGIEDERFKISTRIVSASSSELNKAGGGGGGDQLLVVSQLNISLMEPTEMGNYKCLAFNSFGFVQHSSYLSLPANEMEPLRIERRHYQPAKVNVIAGQTASLQCPLIGHPLARVDWFRQDNQELRQLPSSHRQRIEPVNKWGFGGQLELINVDKTAGDAGLYSCRVARQIQAIGSSGAQNETYDDDLVGQVRVEVRVAPLIDRQTLPELVHANEGMRTKLVCSVVQGDRPIEIRWLRRTHDRRNPAQEQLLAFGGFEEVKQPQPQQAAAAAAAATKQSEEDEDSISIHNLEDSSLLTFRQISYFDSGDYLCLASNQVSHSTRLTRILVNTAPSWSSEPPNELSVLLGARLQIDCLAHGYPEPAVVWRKRRAVRQQQQQQHHHHHQATIKTQDALIAESEIAGPRHSSESAAAAAAAPVEMLQEAFMDIGPNYKRRQPTNGSLIIEQSDQSDAGLYQCQVGNGIGVGLSKVVRVRVNVAPHFKHRPGSSVSQAVGARAELKCLAFGDQPMVIGWRRDNNPDDPVVDLLNDSRHRQVSEHRLPVAGSGPAALESVLQVDNLTRQDSGQYVCVASNEFGSEEMRIQLIVQEPPEAPNLLRPVRAGSRQATLSFRPPYTGNSPIKQYAIYYRAPNNETKATSGGGGEWQLTLVDAQSAQPELLFQATLDNNASTVVQRIALMQHNADQAPDQQLVVNLLLCCLQPFTRYLVKVRAINELGQGEASKLVPFVTDEEAIGGPPIDVAVEPTGAHSLKVRWRAPAKNMQNGLIRGYYIGYRAIGNLGPTISQQVGGSGPPPTTSDEQYQYKNVQLDPGPAALLTPLLDPFGGGGEFAESSSSSSSSSPAPLPWSGGGVSGPGNQVFASYLTNLKRKTAYSIIVQAYNKVGAGPRSDQIIVSTLDAAPPMSPVLKLLSVGYSAAQFAWASRRFKHNSINSSSLMPGGQYHHQRLGLIIDAANMDDDLGQTNGQPTSIASLNTSGERESSNSDVDDDDDDDPQSYYTINFRPDPIGGGTGANSDQSQQDWQQRRVPARRQSVHSPHQLTGLKCGSWYSAFMTATNSLGQSEPGETVKFATMGAAPIAPNQAQDFLQVNSSYVVLRLGQWQNAGCLIGLFVVKYRPLNQLKWTVLEHQVHPTLQTLTISGSALLSTRATTNADQPVSHHFVQPSASQQQQTTRGNSRMHAAQLLSDLIIRNLQPDTNYKLIVEANSEAGSTLAEYEFETTNYTSSTVAINVNGLNAADLPSSSWSSGGDNRPYSLAEPGGGGDLQDFNYNQPRGFASSTVVGPLQRYALGVWSLTALFVLGSILMAVATLILGFRSIMRMKPGTSDDGSGLMSAMLCCSGRSSSRSSSSDNADSSSSGGHRQSCYQLPDLHSTADGYCSLAANNMQQQQLNRVSQFLENAADEVPFRQLVSSSSLSTIGRFNSNSNNNNPNAQQQVRNTHTLGRLANQDQGRQLLGSAACYAATLGKQQSTFVGQTPMKFNQESPIYGRLQQHQQNSHYTHGEPDTPQFGFSGNPPPQPMSSSGGTSGYETSANSMNMKRGCPSEAQSEQRQQPIYLQHNNYHQHLVVQDQPAPPPPEELDGINYGNIAENNLYGANQLNYQLQEPRYSEQIDDNFQKDSTAAFSISGNKIDCEQTQHLYGMIFGNQQQQQQQQQQQRHKLQDCQQLEPRELSHRLHTMATSRQLNNM